MKFAKMNGLGNDYIYFYQKKDELNLTKEEIKKLCNRNFGIGGDGVVVISKSSIADCKMTIYNADGTRAENCGNALRCVVKYAHDNFCRNKNISVETDVGIKSGYVNNDDTISVNIGEYEIQTKSIKLLRKIIDGHFVSVGNPHFVVKTENLDKDFCCYAKDISNLEKNFNSKVNVEFFSQTTDGLRMRVFERGVGETLACGTGASAVFAVANETGLCGDNVLIELKGGILNCCLNSKKEILINSKVFYNFFGEIDL